MADKLLWMPLNPADYHRDTRHLSTLEHGAYLLLLMTAWTGGGKLPADPARLARIAGLDADQWAECGPVVMAFFDRKGDAFEHKRIARELRRADGLVEQKRAAGRASAKARAEKAKSNGRSTGVPTEGPTKSNQLQLQSNSLSKDKGDSASEAKRLFDDGVALLVGAGDQPKAARSFLGKLRKGHGDAKVLAAVTEATRLAISEPKEWLVAALNKPANDRDALLASINRKYGDEEKVA